MGFLKLPGSRHNNNRPEKPFEIDWSNPITKGLTICVIGGHQRELVHGYKLKYLNGASVEVTGGEQSIQTRDALSTVELEGSGSLNLPADTNLSFFAKMQRLSTDVTGTIIAKRTGVACEWQVYTGDRLSFRIGAEGNVNLVSNSSNVWQDNATTYDASTNTITGFLNGVSGTSQTLSSNPQINSAPISLGSRWDTYPTPTYDGDFLLPIVLVWYGRILTLDEINSLGKDPYQVLKPVNDEVYFYPSGILNPIAVNDSYDVIDGVQKVVTAPGILDNDIFECN